MTLKERLDARLALAPLVFVPGRDEGSAITRLDGMAAILITKAGKSYKAQVIWGGRPSGEVTGGKKSRIQAIEAAVAQWDDRRQEHETEKNRS